MRRNRKLARGWRRWFDLFVELATDAAIMGAVVCGGWLFIWALGGDGGPAGAFMAGLLMLGSVHLLRWRDDGLRLAVGLGAGAAGFLMGWAINF